MYPARTVTVSNYDWKVEIFEASLAELDDLKASTGNDTEFAAKILSFIKAWNCTDKEGQLLELKVESLRKLPQSVLRFIITSIAEPFKDDELKNALKLSPTSAQGQEATAPGIPAQT
jgi:hypothetical protein